MPYPRLILLVAGLLSTTSGLRAEKDSQPAPVPNFWDEIPPSHSTTAAIEIKDGYWRGQFARVNREVAAADHPELVFFGDSITWHWSLGAATGEDIWKRRYANYRPINMGNSGDITPVMLHRVTHGNLDFPAGHAPKVAVLLCGTNNFVVTKSAGGEVEWKLGADCPPEDVAAGARAIAQVFRRRLPTTRVIMLGILPVANKTKWPKCRKVNAVNGTYSYNQDEIVFLDLQDHFLQSDGSLNRALFTDGTHLTPEGYQVWADSIGPVMDSMMKAPPLDPTQIMLIGDAPTEGSTSATCYRRYLDGMLRREGHLIDFVGSRRLHHGNKTAPDCYQFDPDHEGYSGKDSAWLAAHLPGQLSKSPPDIAILHLGTEDIIAGKAEPGPLTDNIITNITTIISALRDSNPTAQPVVSQLTPIPGKEETVALLNRKIAGLNAKLPFLIVAKPPTDFDPAADLANNSRLPNTAGASKIADSLAGAINRVISSRRR